ncbi:DUF3348 family protein [Aquabacterium sp.]|uniref:DUF3348 family protein n=1 Tax=Aquabacterium sp. TaxID=1872578 RepID=UPI002E327933|nr:DUF3348 family protein [Aquabacterium sp.]HEX5312001.1 DUF3348 family protein [Aquabacterium sp.]
MSSLSRSRLVRLLSDLACVEGEDSRQDVAERLSHWLDAVSAVRLDGALQSIQAYARQKGVASMGAAGPLPVAELEQALQRMRLGLMQGFGSAALNLAALPHEGEPDYGPYYQRYLELQRQMESKVAALRAQLRQALSRGSVAQRQLAALDAVMEQMLGPRQQKLWTSVPVYLERRFEQLRQTRHADGDAGGSPQAWQVTFGRQWQELLQAELQARLEPVMGLLEAARQEVRIQ